MAVHRIVVQKGIGGGASSQRRAIEVAQRHAEKGTRLYGTRDDKDGYHFVNRAEEDFEEGSIIAKQASPGVTVYTGKLKKVAAPKYKRAKTPRD